MAALRFRDLNSPWQLRCFTFRASIGSRFVELAYWPCQAPDAVLDIDRDFAAGGFMMAAALAARRKGNSVDRRRRFRWFGRA